MLNSSNVWILIPLAFIAAYALGEIASHVRKYCSHRHELSFKSDLVERGLSIEEIERLLVAKSPSSEK